ncbi:2-dehydropantoate 2-reductase [Virgibacillus doumboii]|uniref:2-dehydropantoate 2-reductase n=1 Tax=Virgibacillus doumboii TaxID=2697503 RepID=UPI0013E0A6B4|nr:2-dehydropantoate 2-reductase [Virgibacillus doumboii]
MKLGIIGGGSVGLLLGGFLAKNHQVTVYVKRGGQKQLLNKHGIWLVNATEPVPVRSLLLDEMRNEECFIVCVKQPHISRVIPAINKTNMNTPVIFLQNGMEHIKLLEKVSQPAIVGVVEHGAIRKNDYSVAHRGRGNIKLAVFKGERSTLDSIERQLHQPDFPIESFHDWELLLHEKLIVNAVINPISALFDITNGGILKNVHIQKLAREICCEVSFVLNLDFNEQWNRVQTIAEQTGNNVSSMLKDIRENNETEIEAICGYLIKRSKQPIPYTSFIYQSIKALEEKKEKIK